MANTFNLGNGNWAQKTEKLLAYNAENDNYKPLPFDFDRASTATRVNKDGLIETVGTDEPRIDFLNNTKGHLLLEPSRTNVIQNSEITSTWTYTEFGSGSAGTITTGKTDMFGGTNAVQVDFPSDAENATLTFGQTTSSISSGSAAVSVYIKLVSSGSKELQFRCSTGIKSNVLVDTTGFVRYEVTGTKGSNESFSVKVRPSEGTSSGGFSIIICHPQEEAGSYATSIIPTQGSAVTRSADTCSGAGNSNVINSTEGVLYAEIAALADDSTYKRIALSNGSTTNRVVIGTNNTSDTLRCFAASGGSLQADFILSISDITLSNKIAFKYKANDFALWVNGIKVGTDTSGSAPTGLNMVRFEDGDGGYDFYGKTKEIRVYNTALTDAELIALTS